MDLNGTALRTESKIFTTRTVNIKRGRQAVKLIIAMFSLIPANNTHRVN